MYELCQSTSPPFPVSVDVGRDRCLSYSQIPPTYGSQRASMKRLCPTCIAGSIPLNHLDLKCPKISPAPSKNGANVGEKKHCCAKYSHRFMASASVKNLRPGHSNLQGWPISMQYPRHTPWPLHVCPKSHHKHPKTRNAIIDCRHHVPHVNIILPINRLRKS